jgi:hypothetical protein
LPRKSNIPPLCSADRGIGLKAERGREISIILSLILLAVGVFITILSLLFEIKPGDGKEFRASVRMIGVAFIIIAVVILVLVTSSHKGRVPRMFGFRELVIMLGCWLLFTGLFQILYHAMFYFRDFTDVLRFFERIALWDPMSLVLVIVGTLIAVLGLRMPIRAPGEEVKSDLRSMTTGFALTYVGIGVVMTLPLLYMVGLPFLLTGILVICANLGRRIRKGRNREDPWSEYH